MTPRRRPSAPTRPGSSPADLAAENARLRRDLERAKTEHIRPGTTPRAAGPDACPAGPRRLARSWAAPWPPPGGPPGSRRAGLRGLAALPAVGAHHRGPARPSHRSEPDLPDLRGGGPETCVWLGDLTCVRTGEGWLHLAAVLDLHTRKIVGWSMRETARTARIARRRRSTWRPRRQRPAPGPDLPCGQGHPARLRAVSGGPGRGQDHAVHEPQGQLPRQCPHGELLPLAHGSRGSTTASQPQGSRPDTTCSRGSRAGHNTHRLHSALGYRSPAAMERMAA